MHWRIYVKITSLKEFWGKRWNLAFSEMTALIVYRPSKEHTGRLVALLVAFMLSGLLHEVAITFPVHGGYGMPLIYFIIQAVMMIVEERNGFKRRNNAVSLFWNWA